MAMLHANCSHLLTKKTKFRMRRFRLSRTYDGSYPLQSAVDSACVVASAEDLQRHRLGSAVGHASEGTLLCLAEWLPAAMERVAEQFAAAVG